MDQESNSKPGNRGSWRDRLGITDDGASKPEAPSAPAQAPAKQAARNDAKVVAKPAPMAPRPGSAAKAPVRSKPAQAKGTAGGEKTKPASERPQATGGAKDDAFAERLRQHRAAAEEAVKKRSSSPGLDKFSFAKKEVESARAEVAPAPKPTAPPSRPAAAPVKPALSSPAPAPVHAAAVPQRPAAPAPRGNQLQPVKAPGVGGPPPRPGQFAPPQSPYGQPPYGQPPQQPHAQPQHPPSSYRPAGPGYAQQPPAPRPQPPQGYQPQGADPYGRGGYAAPPRQPVPHAVPGQGQRFAPPAGEHDLFEDNGYRPAAPLGRAAPGRNEPLRPDFDDPFDDHREYGGRTANDYSQAYREYDDEDYEEDEPRRWGGLIAVVLALLAIGAIAAGLIYWYTQQKSPSSGAATEVPVINAPETPVKAQPDANANPPATAPAQGKKLIYDRILGTGNTSEPERIVPREETPQAPANNSGEGNLLPLPLPPPPQTQGSLTPGETGPEPAQQTASTARANQQVQGAAGGNEPAASAVLAPAPAPAQPALSPPVRQGSIGQPPIPRSKPRNLVASVQQAPSTQFRPVLQPTPAPAPSQQLNAPVDLQQQAAIVTPQVQAPVNTQIPAPAPAPAVPQTRSASRDDDPLSGLRAPLNAANQPAQQVQQVPQTFQQQAVVAPQPLPTPPPAPQQQQPITQQSLQSFSPPPVDQNQAASAPAGSGYVVQLAAYRSEQEALGQYQQLRSRHSNIIGNLPPAVQQTNLGASGTFYRLGMGPMSSKQAATEMCNKLIAAGERDCLVRRR